MSEVTWQGRTVPVKSEPVRLFLLNVADTDSNVAQTAGLENKISIYESVLKQCIDAQQALRETLQDDQVGDPSHIDSICCLFVILIYSYQCQA